MSNKITVLILLLCISLLATDVVAAGAVTGFIYHRFNDTRYPSTNIAAEVFQAQIEFLKEQNYTLLSYGEIARRLVAGEALPEKGAAISVDDAFTSFVEAGMPIVRRFEIPVTLFVNTDSVGTPGYLDWEQLRTLQKEGVEIGNHTATHGYLVELEKEESLPQWRERIRQDILKAQNAIDQQLGTRPTIFAYPYGEYSPELLDIVEGLGFLAAFAQQSGVIHSTHNRFFLPRFPMGGPYGTLSGFKNKIAMKPLLVEEEQPLSPLLIGENPPELQLRIEDSSADLRRINCFVQGENSCKAEAIGERRGWFRVVAEQPLAGRRNKFTLTAPGKAGGWHWYSHLWVRADAPAIGVPGLPKMELTPQPETGGGKTVKAILPNQ